MLKKSRLISEEHRFPNIRDYFAYCDRLSETFVANLFYNNSNHAFIQQKTQQLVVKPSLYETVVYSYQIDNWHLPFS